MKKWIPLIICLLLPVGVICLLAAAAPDINKSGNGFRRTWLYDMITKTNSFAILPTIKNIAGVEHGFIYFSSKEKGVAVRLDLSNGNQESIKFLSTPNLINQLDASNQLIVRDSTFWLYNSTPALIIKGNLKGDVSSIVKLKEPFTKLVLTDSGMIVRKFIPGVRDQALYKLNSLGEMLTTAPRITDDNGDGGLSTEGILLYNNVDKSTMYIGRNSNRVTVLNEDMTIKKVGKTIDTFFTNRYTASQYQLKSGNVVTNGAPIQYINIGAAINADFLYVQSGVRSDSDDRNSFSKDLVLDVYSLKNMEYIGSIAAKGVKEKLRSWVINDNRILVLKSSTLEIYDLK
ncbi:hypothetical protein [Filimonas effusa]|uniref:6-bladed beta-propeller n=1 Tax=Filimonas effusa TaxID=2508721 RepID=A0A4V1M9M0_9BACT|nr:hypothetical protein [Filimonas effusa]RXK81680.1 hypothetical protein ESB13_17950 [Filimonas effusa]